jgi:hypothetical protein
MRDSDLRCGWNKPMHAFKWHYFRNGRALCGGWVGAGLKSVVFSMDNRRLCKECVRRLEKEVR